MSPRIRASTTPPKPVCLRRPSVLRTRTRLVLPLLSARCLERAGIRGDLARRQCDRPAVCGSLMEGQLAFLKFPRLDVTVDRFDRSPVGIPWKSGRA